MPLPIALAHRLSRRLTEVRKNGVLPYLRPDGKTQVTIAYEDNVPVRLDTVVVSTQHAGDVDLEKQLDPDIRRHVLESVLGTSPTKPSTRRRRGCWSTRPASSCSAARWETPG